MQHWEILGTAVASDEHIRLTPDHQSKQGAVWNANVSSSIYVNFIQCLAYQLKQT